MQKFFSITRWAGAKRLLSVMLFLCCTFWAMGQTVTFNKFDITHQTTCEENGSIKVHVNNPGKIQLEYNLLYNGANKQASVNGEFKNLGAGKYQVKVAKTGGNPVYFTKDVEVLKTYKPLTASKPKLTLTAHCDAFKKGGKISVDPSSFAGFGTPPYKYLIQKTNNTSFSDAALTYGDASEFTVDDFGTYMVRIKDACGEKVTVAQEVPLKLPKMQLKASAYYPDCNTSVLWAIRLFKPNTSSQIVADEYFKAGGLKVELYAATSDGLHKGGSEVLFDGVLKEENAKDGKPIHNNYVLKLSPTDRYWGKITTPCGDVFEGPVLDLKTDRRTPLSLSASTTECTKEGEETMTISNLNYSTFIPSGVVKFQNVATGKIEQELPLKTNESHHTFSSKPLPLGKYKVWLEHDKCKEFNSAVHYVELNKGDVGKVAANYNALYPCDGYQYTSITGTTSVEVKFTGYLPNQKHANVTIESGPTNVGVKGYFFQYRYRWYNMLPGDYVIKYESCGQVLKFPITVKNDESILRQSIVSKAISACGAKGRIESTIDCNHYFPKTVELVDKDNKVVLINGKLQENSSGLFTDLPAGEYRTRLKIKPNCGGANSTYYIYNSELLTILGASDEPKFVEAQGIACESLIGTTGGSIYLTLAADATAKLKYRKVGVAAWTDLTYANSVVVPNLEANQSYEFSLESCGKTATTTVLVKKLGVFVKSKAKHPCINDSYELKAPRYIGAAYSWRKASGGPELSNTEILKFSRFTVADNGMYICKLQWGNCVTREFRFYLDASKCAHDVTEVVSGTVYHDESDNHIIDGTPIGEVDTKLLYIQVVEDDGAGSYTHSGIIKQVESDGSFLIDGLATDKKYRLILTTSNTQVTTASAIPSWSFVGEATGDQPSDVDGTPDGMLDIVAGDGDQMDLRFGIKKQKSPAVLRSNRHITTKL